MLKERAHEYYLSKDKNCAETLLLSAIDEYKLPLNEEHANLLGGFGGGVGCGHLCGAVAGSVAAIGFMTIKTTAHQSEMLKLARAEFLESFAQKAGSLMCNDLKDKYFDSENTKCFPVVEIACECLDEVVKKYELA